MYLRSLLKYDSKEVPDVWDVYGTVTCKADLEGMSPEVTLTLGHADSAVWSPLENLLYHPCVQNYQTQGICTCTYILIFFTNFFPTNKNCYLQLFFDTDNSIPRVGLAWVYSNEIDTALGILIPYLHCVF